MGNHEWRNNKNLNHVSREKKKKNNHAAWWRYREPSLSGPWTSGSSKNVSTTTVLESWPLTGMVFVRGEFKRGFTKATKRLAVFLRDCPLRQLWLFCFIAEFHPEAPGRVTNLYNFNWKLLVATCTSAKQNQKQDGIPKVTLCCIQGFLAESARTFYSALENK